MRRLMLSGFHLTITITQIRSFRHPRSSTSPYSLLNKQDSPDSLSATEIRDDYEEWDQRRRESAQRQFGEDKDAEMERKRQRIASLDVMGVSALDE